MNDHNRNQSKENPSSFEAQSSEPSEILAQIQKIQTHLGFLEKKLDLLLAQQPQSREGGFGGNRGGREGGFRPSRPPFRGGFNRRDRGEGGGGFKRRDRGDRDRDRGEGGGHFPREHRGEGRPFKKRRPHF